MKTPIISIKNLTKDFKIPKRNIEVLKGVDFDIYEGEYILIFGPSGCGKTTLLNLILGLETPTEGEIIIAGKSMGKLLPFERAAFRAKNFGTVYQNAIWLKSFDVLDNVALPLYLEGVNTKEAQKQALYALTKANMFEFARSRPNELSSGEQQRINLARAIVSEAPIIIADEPTGNLDTKAGNELMKTLDHLNKQHRTIILVTHNLSYLVHADRKVAMKDGRIIGHFTGNVLPEYLKEILEEE